MRACSETLKLCVTGNQYTQYTRYTQYSVSAVQDDDEYIPGKNILCSFHSGFEYYYLLIKRCNIKSFRYLISFEVHRAE